MRSPSRIGARPARGRSRWVNVRRGCSPARVPTRARAVTPPPVPARVLLAALLATAAFPARAGDVVGVVRLRGGVPALPPLPITKDQPACGATQPDESLRVQGGAVANAVVALAGVAPPPPARLRLDQERCRFVPRVQVAPVGSTLEVGNGDPVLHTAHGWQEKRSVFDVQTPSRGDRGTTRPLTSPGVVRIACDVHAWMAAFVWVSDGPAAVSAADGTFRLGGIPAGTYTWTAWHERLGRRSAHVTVPEAGEARLEVVYGD